MILGHHIFRNISRHVSHEFEIFMYTQSTATTFEMVCLCQESCYQIVVTSCLMILKVQQLITQKKRIISNRILQIWKCEEDLDGIQIYQIFFIAKYSLGYIENYITNIPKGFYFILKGWLSKWNRARKVSLFIGPQNACFFASFRRIGPICCNAIKMIKKKTKKKGMGRNNISQLTK